MKVILLKDLAKKGQKGDILDVSDGYAKNYLIKNKYAVQLNKESSYLNKTVEREKQKQADIKSKRALEVYEKINNSKIIIKVKTNDENRIFGSITPSKICKILDQEKKVQINKKELLYFKALHLLGTYNLDIKLSKQYIAKLTILVEKE